MVAHGKTMWFKANDKWASVTWSQVLSSVALSVLLLYIHSSITKKRNFNNFNISMGPIHFAFFWSSQYDLILWKVSEHKLTSWTVNQCKQSIDRLQREISYFRRIPFICFLKYLFINTYKATPYHLGLQLVSLNHRLVVFASRKDQLEFDNTRPAGWPLISRIKSSYATIVLCSIDLFLSWLI